MSGGSVLITLWTSVLGAFCRPHNYGQGMVSAVILLKAACWQHCKFTRVHPCACMSWKQEVFAWDSALV